MIAYNINRTLNYDSCITVSLRWLCFTQHPKDALLLNYLFEKIGCSKGTNYVDLQCEACDAGCVKHNILL